MGSDEKHNGTVANGTLASPVNKAEKEKSFNKEDELKSESGCQCCNKITDFIIGKLESAFGG